MARKSVLQQVRKLCTLTQILLEGKHISPTIIIKGKRLLEGNHVETLSADIGLTSGIENGFLASHFLIATSNLDEERVKLMPNSIEAYDYFSEVVELIISSVRRMPNQENVLVENVLHMGAASIPNERALYSLNAKKSTLIRALQTVKRELQN